MVITRDYSRNTTSRPIVTLGFFDGVHLGHAKILESVVNCARENNKNSLLITFWPHPRIVLHNDSKEFKLLTSLPEKQKIVEAIGIDYMLIMDFTPDLAKQSASSFIQNILIDKLNASVVVVGYNHVFGHKGQGNFDLLKQFESSGDFRTIQVGPIQINGVKVSSTKIRAAIEEGAIDMANSLLDRPYSLTGTIEGGKQIGRSIGFPTANISPTEPLKQIPGDGVYAVCVDYKGLSYPAMLNIGNKPTLGHGSQRTIEAHIIGFDQNIYNEEITVRFMKRIRNEKKFPTLDDLKAQLAKDKEKTIEVLSC
jgi:riboflavin kinase/FMN adenylyltransferase